MAAASSIEGGLKMTSEGMSASSAVVLLEELVW